MVRRDNYAKKRPEPRMQSHEENASSMTRDRFLSSSSLRANAEKIGISSITSGSQAEQRRDRQARSERSISRLGNAGLEAAQQHELLALDRADIEPQLRRTGRARRADRRDDKMAAIYTRNTSTEWAPESQTAVCYAPKVAAAAAQDARMRSMRVVAIAKKKAPAMCTGVLNAPGVDTKQVAHKGRELGRADAVSIPYLHVVIHQHTLKSQPITTRPRRCGRRSEASRRCCCAKRKGEQLVPFRRRVYGGDEHRRQRRRGELGQQKPAGIFKKNRR